MEENTTAFDISQYSDAVDFNSAIAFVVAAGAGIIGIRLAFKGIDWVKRTISKS